MSFLMSLLRLFLFCIILFLSLPDFLTAQTYLFKNYSVDDGLPQSAISAIYQDREGYIWFGSKGGLTRFDGVDFKTYSNIRDINLSWIWAISGDREGRLMIGTESGGLVFFDGSEWTSYKKGSGLIDNTIRSVLQDSDGTYWIGTPEGLSIFDGNTWKSLTKRDGLPGSVVRDIYEDRNGRIWLSMDEGICFIDLKTKKVNIPGFSKLFKSAWEIAGDSEGTLWIGTTDGLISCKESKNGIEIPVVQFTVEQGLTDNVVRSVFIDSRGIIWIGTRGGVNTFDGKKFTSITRDNGLINNMIWTIREDSEKNLWFGTRTGISKYSGADIITYTLEDGIPNEIILSLTFDNKNRLWVTTNNGIGCMDGNKWKYYNSSDGIGHRRAKRVISASDGRIWIGTENGVSVFDGKKWRNYSTDEGLINKTVRTVFEDRDGNIWIGTRKGICKFDGKKFTNIEGITCPVRSVAQNSDGILYFGTHNGLIEYDGKDLKMYTKKDGLVNDIVLTVYIDKKDKLWIGTRGGFSRFVNGKFINYTEKDGISSNICRFIIQKDNYYYIGTAKGVNRFDGNSSFKLYNFSTGMSSSEVLQESCVIDSKGNMWIGTLKGISVLNTESGHSTSVPPPVYIETVTAAGIEKPPGRDLILSHNRNSVTIGFTGICLTVPENVRYKYKMEGLDEEWSYTGQRSVTYASLPAGNFVFKVAAQNHEEVWSLKPAELKISVSLPFWQTRVFKMAIFLAALGLISGIAFWRTQDLQQRNILLKTKVKERTTDLERKSDELGEKVDELQESMLHIKRLEGLLPICCSCKKIKLEEKGSKKPVKWIQVEQYISDRTDADFSHGICPECKNKLYPDINNNNNNKS